MPKLKEVIQQIEEIFPPALATQWDNTGLQLGDPDLEVRKVMVALDPLPEVLLEAADKKINLLVTHHPLFFNSIKSLDISKGSGMAAYLCMKNGIAVYAAHTSFDRAAGGLNDFLAERLGLINTRPLEPLQGDAGRGRSTGGFGRIGSLKTPITASALAERVKKALSLKEVRLTGEPDRKIKIVSVCGGSGADMLEIAAGIGADAFVTGDVKYHQALAARESGVCLIDAGHQGTELPAMEYLASRLREKFREKGLKISVENCAVRVSPWTTT
ncbi:MAG: Nif3-like dinuclear metal center hexameric protein [Nitrospirota bacterium]